MLVSLELWNASVDSLDDSAGQYVLVRGAEVKRYRQRWISMKAIASGDKFS